MVITKTACRNCGKESLEEFLDLGPQQIQGSFVYPDKPHPPIRAVRGILLRCANERGGCGLVQNRYTLPPEILYSNYGYRSSISKTMRDHLTDISTDIKELERKNYGSIKRVILDVGANDLFFLKTFGEGWTRLGIDPCDIITQVDPEGISVINTCYSSSSMWRNSDYLGKFGVITTIACFYDMDSPRMFAAEIARHLHPEGFWVVEFAYLPTVLKNLAYDGMVHEHVCLYSLSTFKNVVEQWGLRVFRVETNDTNGGSLQVWVCRNHNYRYDTKEYKENIQKLLINEFDMGLDTAYPYERFAMQVREHKENFVACLKKLRSQQERIHAYGMSTKLNTILQYCEVGTNFIEAAAERDPAKVGARTLSGIPIISEEESRKRASVYLVGPYHFKNEILARERETMNQGVKFLFPLPNIELINESTVY